MALDGLWNTLAVLPLLWGGVMVRCWVLREYALWGVFAWLLFENCIVGASIFVFQVV